MTHLNISNEEQCRRFHRCFGIDDLLDAAGPVHGLVEVLGVEPVAVLPSIHRDAPVAFKKNRNAQGGVDTLGHISRTHTVKEDRESSSTFWARCISAVTSSLSFT